MLSFGGVENWQSEFVWSKMRIQKKENNQKVSDKHVEGILFQGEDIENWNKCCSHSYRKKRNVANWWLMTSFGPVRELGLPVKHLTCNFGRDWNMLGEVRPEHLFICHRDTTGYCICHDYRLNYVLKMHMLKALSPSAMAFGDGSFGR